MEKFEFRSRSEGGELPSAGDDRRAEAETDDQEALLTVPQAARWLKVCERTLFDHTKKRRIKVVRIGRSVRYRPSAVREFIARHESGH